MGLPRQFYPYERVLHDDNYEMGTLDMAPYVGRMRSMFRIGIVAFCATDVAASLAWGGMALLLAGRNGVPALLILWPVWLRAFFVLWALIEVRKPYLLQCTQRGLPALLARYAPRLHREEVQTPGNPEAALAPLRALGIMTAYPSCMWHGTALLVQMCLAAAICVLQFPLLLVVGTFWTAVSNVLVSLVYFRLLIWTYRECVRRGVCTPVEQAMQSAIGSTFVPEGSNAYAVQLGMDPDMRL